MKIYILNISVLVLFTGCGYDYYNRGLVVNGDDYYKVPKGTTFGKVSKSILKVHPRSRYIDCKENDISFIDTEYVEKESILYDEYANNKGTINSELDTFYKRLASERKIGCTSPLTDKEYQFYIRKDNIQRDDNNKAFDSFMKATEYKPNNYNTK